MLENQLTLPDGALARHARAGWDVHVFSGCNLSHACELPSRRAPQRAALPADSTDDGHRFHAIVGMDSTASWASIPRLGQP
ncbi:hypothetical protein, partial [Camelimonas lactis]|uniref:hypothetical protein n=1 Tax=Camelimonas lactis TaxID=659006 RepID=UPI001A9D2502